MKSPSPAKTPRKPFGRVPSFSFSDSSPSKPLNPSGNFELLPWESLKFADWLTQFRMCIKRLVYQFISLAQQVFLIYELNEREHYRDYIELQHGVYRLWLSWKTFASAKEVDEVVLFNSPVYFDYVALIRRMRTPRKVKVASQMADIRKNAYDINQGAIVLQGHLIEVQQRMEDAAAEEDDQKEQATSLPFLETNEVPALDPIVEIQLNGGELVKATDQFEIDKEGCALRSLTATDENWMSIQQLLPKPLRHVIAYTKGAWSIGRLVGRHQMPLFLANRPVVLVPPGIHGPILVPFNATPDPPDPLSDLLDPLRSLSDQEVEGIFSYFPEATEVMIFFDHHLLLSFPDEESFARAILPQSFGGLTVAKTIILSRLSIESTPPSQLSPVEPVATHTEDRITLVGGDELIVHGALFGEDPEDGEKMSKLLSEVLAVYSSSDPASAGVVVRKIGQHYLTTVSHLYRIADLAHCRLSEHADVPPSAPRMIYDQNDRLIGTIESFEDDLEEANESSSSYQTDLCYIRLEQHIHFQIASDEDPRPWRFYRESDGDGVLYNERLRMWCRSMGMMMGAAVGQGFAKRSQTLGLPGSEVARVAESEGLKLRDQLARSLLWRSLGPFESLAGKSGSPIELVQESEERVIIGFQNFEVYTPSRGTFTWSAVEDQDEDYTQAALQSAYYPFYGSFHLPTWVRSLDIVNGDIN